MTAKKEILHSVGKTFPCLTLIGMAGAGKSTIGSLLAKKLDWAFLDTDQLIEALYARRLEEVTRSISREEFLDLEEKMIQSLQPSRTIIATGGSVIYRPAAMRHLACFGPVVYLKTDFEIIRQRIEEKPDRGLVIEAGQSLEGLYQERAPLYDKYCGIMCDSGAYDPDACVDFIIKNIPGLLAPDAEL